MAKPRQGGAYAPISFRAETDEEACPFCHHGDLWFDGQVIHCDNCQASGPVTTAEGRDDRVGRKAQNRAMNAWMNRA